MGKEKKTQVSRLSASLRIGAVALAFLVTGYQIALFIHSASVERIVSNRDRPDTVYVYSQEGQADVIPTSPETGPSGASRDRTMSGSARRNTPDQRSGGHSPEADRIYEKNHRRTVETFNFDPNTVSVEDLQRLGFTERQAQAIDNYRQKGGRFNRASDFSKSFVVADSVFRRLEKHIIIPKTDINTADSTAFDLLPGIGPYYASKMVSYRESLGGYSFIEQLLDIYGFDEDKLQSLRDLITLTPPSPYPLWTLSEKELEKHPYIGRYGAHGIIIFRENNPKTELSVENIAKAGILKAEDAARLQRCVIADP